MSCGGSEKKKVPCVGKSVEAFQGKLHLISLKVVSVLTKAGMEYA